MIYFVRALPSGNIKIGFSRSMPSRLRVLQGCTTEALSVLGTLPGGFKLEASLHSKFAGARVSGEWFRPSLELLGYVQDNTTPYNEKTAVADEVATANILLPKLTRQLAALGERIRLARHRRQLTAEMVAERAGISRPTYREIEQGAPGVALGRYLSVLHVLGLEAHLDTLAEDDELGRHLEDARIGERVRIKRAA